MEQFGDINESEKEYINQTAIVINRDPFFYHTLPTLIIELCVGHRWFLSSIECNI